MTSSSLHLWASAISPAVRSSSFTSFWRPFGADGEEGGVQEQRRDANLVEVAPLERLEALAQLLADPRCGRLRELAQPGLLAQRLDVAHREAAHEGADHHRLQWLGAQQLGPARKQRRDERLGRLADLRDLQRQFALGGLQPPRPIPVAQPRRRFGATLIARAAQPRLELLLDRALDDQPRPELGQL